MCPRWSDVSENPNSRECFLARQKVLDRAWSRDSRKRFEILTELYQGRKVLDLGCVDHPLSILETPAWLHRQLAAVASRCVGVDNNAKGVERMIELGYEALCADFETILDVLSDERFDVIVAGEIIEHLGNPQALFDRVRDLLVPHGQFVVTTPNPYARHRVLAGRLRVTWENVDHVTYLFPAGMVELAERSGLELAWYTSIRDPRGTWDWHLAAKQLRGVIADTFHRRPRAPQLVTELLLPMVGPRTGAWVGETNVYVFRQPGLPFSFQSPT